MAEPRIQYVESSDGTSIAYWTLGQGQPLVILENLPLSNHQLLWRRFPHYRNWCERLAANRRLVGYDARGLGLSGRHPASYDLDAHVSDLEAVASKPGLETFALLGSSHAGAIAVSYTVRHPERVSHLLLWGAYARAADYAASPRIQASRALLEKDWEAYVDTLAFYILRLPDEDQGKAAADFIREATTPEAMRSALAEIDRFDVRDLLPAVKAPTLVMNRRKAAWPSLDVATDLAARIPGARLVAFEGVGPVPWASDVEEIAGTIYEFLGEEPLQVEVDVEEAVDAALTSRETEVLALVASGHSNKEIAHQLSLSVHTVQRHVANIYNKIGARGRADATAYALKHRLL
jgi:pimeloyl-ACP methyl ester carboxylesterase/DNA-binding CsgD family transcriptional regulator